MHPFVIPCVDSKNIQQLYYYVPIPPTSQHIRQTPTNTNQIIQGVNHSQNGSNIQNIQDISSVTGVSNISNVPKVQTGIPNSNLHNISSIQLNNSSCAQNTQVISSTQNIQLIPNFPNIQNSQNVQTNQNTRSIPNTQNLDNVHNVQNEPIRNILLSNHQILPNTTGSKIWQDNQNLGMTFFVKERPHSKHKFTEEEDEKLKKIVSELGEFNWKRISEEMGTRNYRQCRERWKNYLSPTVCKEPWTADEDSLLLKLYQKYGSQWTIIAKHFPNRTDVNLKNRWVVISSHEGEQAKRIRKKSQNKPQVFPTIRQHQSLLHVIDKKHASDDATFLTINRQDIGCINSTISSNTHHLNFHHNMNSHIHSNNTNNNTNNNINHNLDNYSNNNGTSHSNNHCNNNINTNENNATISTIQNINNLIGYPCYTYNNVVRSYDDSSIVQYY